jgi:hypothetical protein
MSDSEQPSFEDHPMYREFVRIVGETLGRGQGFVILPLVGEAEALEFLRTVPAGTPLSELPAFAAAFHATHPLIPPAADSEDEDEAV